MVKKIDLTTEEKKNLIGKIIIRFLLLPLLFGLLTLLPAGTLQYWQVYVYFTFLTVPMVFVLFYFLKHDPRFLERRTRVKEKEKAQVRIQLVFTLIFLSGFIVSGLDRRFGWSNVPVWIVLLTNLVMLLGYVIIFFVFRQNSYASRVVEVETDQKVISTGLYGIVRHPMYVGVLIMWVPIPIALGSWWGLIPMAAIPLALVFRILNEESVLIRELPGYQAYCQKTKYRLIPFIW